LTFSVTTLAQHLESRRQAISIAGSLLVHVGFAAYLLQPTPSAPYATKAGEAGASQGAVTVSLVRRPTPPAASVDTPAQAAATIALASARSIPSPDGVGQASPPATPSGPQTTAPAAAATSAPNGVQTAALETAQADPAMGSDYQRRLLAHIEPFKRYPDDASRTGVRGVVQLVFEIDRTGRVLGVWVSKSSGSSVLDMAAIDTVRRAAPLPPIPTGLPDAMAIQLPVEFSGPG
jgi:protein TonB